MYASPTEKKLLVLARLACGDRVVVQGDGARMLSNGYAVNRLSVVDRLISEGLIAETIAPLPNWVKPLPAYQRTIGASIWGLTLLGHQWLLDHQTGGTKSIASRLRLGVPIDPGHQRGVADRNPSASNVISLVRR